MTFLTSWGVTEIYSIKLVLKGKKSRQIRVSSRIEFLEKFVINNFAFLDTENNTHVAVATMDY